MLQVSNLPEQPMTVPKLQNPSAAVDRKKQAKMELPEKTPVDRSQPRQKTPLARHAAGTSARSRPRQSVGWGLGGVSMSYCMH